MYCYQWTWLTVIQHCPLNRKVHVCVIPVCDEHQQKEVKEGKKIEEIAEQCTVKKGYPKLY